MTNEPQQHNDRHVRDGLNSLRPSAPAGSWDQLAQRLDGSSPVTEEDYLLREKLNGLQPPLAAGSWDELNHRLNNLESDGIIATKINKHAPVSAPSGWAALAAKLELIAARRSAIYSYKFSEICLVLAALILFWYNFPATETPPTVLPFAGAQAAVTPLAEPLPFPERIVSATPSVNAITANEPTSEDEIDYAEITPLVMAGIPSVNFELASVEEPRPRIVASNRPTVTVVDPIPGKDFQLALAPDYLPAPPTNLSIISDKTPRTLFLRTFISPWDFNQVITPRQAVNDIILERDDRISYGSSAGVMLDVQYRKHSMQYGLIYSKRSYIPTVLKDVEDYIPGQGPIERRDTNYSRISFQTLSLPVVYQRELFNNSRWRFAASAGLAVNLNAWATFEKSPTFDQDVLNWTRQSPAPRFGPRSPGSTGLPVIDAQDLVFPEKGLLQGGSLLQNIHLSASFGFSIERYLNDRMSFYVAPRFSRSLYYQADSGAEPFNDRIHNSSVQFGTRILLGQRK